MTFTVASNSFRDGDYLPSDFILSSDFGFNLHFNTLARAEIMGLFKR